MESLLAVPISFVSEHIETLEEIDMEYRELALESGIKHWGRVPALNTNAAFINDLADAVLESLPYVGCMAGAVTNDALVPIGMLQTTLHGTTQSCLCLMALYGCDLLMAMHESTQQLPCCLHAL